MLARRGSQILAFTRRDAVRLVLVSAGLVAGLTFILAFEDLSTMQLISDLVVLAGWLLFSIVMVSLLMAWLWRFRSRLWHRNNAIMLIALTLLSVTLFLVVTAGGTVAPFVVPTAAVGLLLAVLLDAGVALVVTALLAVLAGVITGSMELIAYTFMGGLAGINAVRVLNGEPTVTPPPTTAHGCLVAHVALSDPRRFQPMNTNFGLFPPLSSAPRDKEMKRRMIAQRALEDFAAWKTRSGLS